MSLHPTKRPRPSIRRPDRAATLSRMLAAILILSFSLACPGGHRPLRQSVYPPDFTYLPEDRLRSSMWILAGEIHHLDELLRAQPDPSSARLQGEIQATLRRISAAVEQIDRPGQTTQHPALNRHLSRFAQRLEMAQRGADRTPPNYFQASALSGACFLCHGSAEEAGAG